MSVAPASFPCQRCPETFIRTSGNQKYCPKCKAEVYAEQKAASRRRIAAANRPPLGELELRHPVGPDEHQLAKRALGLDNLDDLLTLGQANDPFYIGTDRHQRMAEWFAGLWERGGFTVAHLRRVHYQMLSTGARRHDGSPYENTEGCWSELGYAARYARYLGLADAEAIVDKRNAPAVVNCPPRKWGETEPAALLEDDWTGWHIPWFSVSAPRLDMPGVAAYGYDYEHADQAALLEVWVEKSTMDDILSPLCAGLGINLVTGKGHESITAIIALLRRAEQHGRAAHILYVSDFDPAGDSMPVAVARQAEFWADRLGISQRITVQPVALTRAQVRGHALPPIPIKDTDRRAPNFRGRHDVAGAVELDRWKRSTPASWPASSATPPPPAWTTAWRTASPTPRPRPTRPPPNSGTRRPRISVPRRRASPATRRR